MRFAGNTIVRLIGVTANQAGERVATLATSRLPTGLYQKNLQPTAPVSNAPSGNERAKILTTCDDIIRTALPDWKTPTYR